MSPGMLWNVPLIWSAHGSWNEPSSFTCVRKASLVVAVTAFSISAGLLASTVTPGRTAPVASLTTPEMLASELPRSTASTGPLT
jgi:hypothetical protein